MGRLAARGPQLIGRISTDPWASHWDGLEVGRGRVCLLVPGRSNQQRRSTTAINFYRQSRGRGSAFNKSVIGQPVGSLSAGRPFGHSFAITQGESIALAFADPHSVAVAGCRGDSGARSSCRPASSGPVRCCNCRGSVRGVC
jgi:hypothetical protein